MARTANLSEKRKTSLPILVSIVGAWNIFSHTNKVSEVCAVRIMMLLLLIMSFVDETGIQAFDNYIPARLYRLKNRSWRYTHLYKYKSGQNRHVSSQLTPFVGGTRIIQPYDSPAPN